MCVLYTCVSWRLHPLARHQRWIKMFSSTSRRHKNFYYLFPRRSLRCDSSKDMTKAKPAIGRKATSLTQDLSHSTINHVSGSINACQTYNTTTNWQRIRRARYEFKRYIAIENYL